MHENPCDKKPDKPMMCWQVFYALIILAGQIFAQAQPDLDDVLNKALNPKSYFKPSDLVVLGNAPLETARIVFLPEIHDDPQSLTTQLVLLALEKQKNRPFLVLDESLASLTKSPWDIFSEKSLEILAASKLRGQGSAYSPKLFEAELKSLAEKFKAAGPGKLIKHTDRWILEPFQGLSMPFYGWDTKLRGQPLLVRNEQLITTLKNAQKQNSRILVMAGARHVPELEFYITKQLLCSPEHYASAEPFFAAISSKYGKSPNLSHSIGATLPIYDYLKDQTYAIAFDKSFYNELDAVVRQFKTKNGKDFCLAIKK